MGVEVGESNLAASMEIRNEENFSMENGKVNIKFGSHGMDEQVKGEENRAFEANIPKDAVDEWPAPQQIHSFYIVKYRSLEDQKLKAKLDLADKELKKMNQGRFQITEKLKAIRADRALVIAQLRSLGGDNKQFRMIMDEKIKEMEPLQHALGKLRGANSGGRERGSAICSSEEELNNLIKSLQYRIQHESIPLNEEKQILREIKLVEGTRNKVIANAAERAKIQESLGEKDAIQDQVKLIGVDLDGVRKEQQVVKAKLKQLDEEKESLEKDINDLQEELAAVAEKRDKTFANIQEMRKQREESNSSYYKNRTLLIKAKELAAKKDIEALKELSDTEVEKFMSLWSSNKAFRDDYERRILPSLDIRHLGRDGRISNPDEKPLVLLDAPTPSGTELVAKTNVKQPPPKEGTVPLAQHDTATDQKVQKEKNSRQQKEAIKKTDSTIERIEQEDTGEGVLGMEKLQKDSPPKMKGLDEIKLKEIRREEEIAKKKWAMERKKKFAEKAAAKAAIKAQKEAEKKLKEIIFPIERGKKAKKKAGTAVAAQDSEEPTEAVAEVAEQENIEEKVETPVPPKNRDRKENTVRHRTRPKGPDSLQKVMLKRKKATNYWVWAAPAVLVVLVLLAIGYNYLL
ncbi:Proton pump-interactor 1 [Forsythia ovata]|uniref:Proton pump-interactor 1 n=1 Tax=Forsythia ovata TaxID=205694 RepID=A0ABD1QD86_9LAMI